jgi:hypothetical protein
MEFMNCNTFLTVSPETEAELMIWCQKVADDWRTRQSWRLRQIVSLATVQVGKNTLQRRYIVIAAGEARQIWNFHALRMVGRLRDPAAAAVGLSERRTRIDKHGHYGEADEDSYELARLKPRSTVSRRWLSSLTVAVTSLVQL